MLIRETWLFLRSALRKWILYELPDNTEISIAVVGPNGVDGWLSGVDLNSAEKEDGRDLAASFLPYAPAQRHQRACIECGLERAYKQYKASSEGSKHILIIAPVSHQGGANFSASSWSKILSAENIRAHVISYPHAGNSTSTAASKFYDLTHDTGGIFKAILEHQQNVRDKSLITTYFDLGEALYSIGRSKYEGFYQQEVYADEIHRRQIKDTLPDEKIGVASNTPNTVYGTFLVTREMVVKPWAAHRNEHIYLYYNDGEQPLIQSMSVRSPQGRVYNKRSDIRLPVKQLTVMLQLNETGTWQYQVDRIQGNPQPHIIQMRTFYSFDVNSLKRVLEPRMWIEETSWPGVYVLYVKVTYLNGLPLEAVFVETKITFFGHSGARNYILRLYDNGAGDPDIAIGDGIYSRYLDTTQLDGAASGGFYQLDTVITDNAGQAYTLYLDGKTETANTFIRTLPTETIYSEGFQTTRLFTPHISDLGATFDENIGIILRFTSPDLGSAEPETPSSDYNSAVRYLHYDIKWTNDDNTYDNLVKGIGNRWSFNDDDDIMNSTESADDLVVKPYLPAQEITIRLNLSDSQRLQLDGKQVYLIIRYYRSASQYLAERNLTGSGSSVSNVAHVLVPIRVIPTRRTSSTTSLLPRGDTETTIIEAASPIQRFLHAHKWEIIIGIIAAILLCFILLAYLWRNGRVHCRHTEKKEPAIAHQPTIISQPPLIKDNYDDDVCDLKRTYMLIDAPSMPQVQPIDQSQHQFSTTSSVSSNTSSMISQQQHHMVGLPLVDCVDMYQYRAPTYGQTPLSYIYEPNDSPPPPVPPLPTAGNPGPYYGQSIYCAARGSMSSMHSIRSTDRRIRNVTMV